MVVVCRLILLVVLRSERLELLAFCGLETDQTEQSKIIRIFL